MSSPADRPPTTAPRLARALLALAAHPDDREYLLDDLAEELADRAARDGARRARRWYRGQAVASLAPLLLRRARVGLRRLVGPAERHRGPAERHVAPAARRGDRSVAPDPPATVSPPATRPTDRLHTPEPSAPAPGPGPAAAPGSPAGAARPRPDDLRPAPTGALRRPPRLRPRPGLRPHPSGGEGPTHRPPGGDALDALIQDLRFALRTFLRRPVFTLTAAGTLALAIGATTTIFGVIDGVLLRPLPGLGESGRVVEMSAEVGGGYWDLAYPLVQAMAEESATLEHVAALDWSPLSVGGGDRPEVRLGVAVTASYFTTLGVGASAGRLFAPEEATFPSVRPLAVISERLRATRFADAPVPGATLVVNGVSLTVIGVTAGGFRGHALTPIDVFLPLGLPVPGLHSEAALTSLASQDVQVLGRLRPGASQAQAGEELTALAGRVLTAAPDGAPPDYRIRVDAWGPVPAVARTGVAAFLTALLVLVGLVLVMASINVAGMVLSRSAERGDEIAVRVALGAGRGRLTRQLLSEAMLLALVAGALALPVAWAAGRLLLAFEPPLPAGFDLTLDVGLDGRILAFCFAVAAASAVLFNLAPSLHAARTDVLATLRRDAGSGRRIRTRGRSTLVAGQMAASLVLLVTAGLFLRSVAAMRGADPGWSADGVWTTDLDLELTGTPDPEGAAFFSALLARLEGAPGVEAAALAHKLPLASASSLGDVTVDGLQPPPGRSGFQAFFLRVSPGYFRTLDLALLEGRDLGAADVEGSRAVAVVNRTMASRLWPDGSPLGGTFRVGPPGAERELTVVGVVEDARYRSLFEETPAFYYLPVGQAYNAHLLLFVRAAGPGGAGGTGAAADGGARAAREAVAEAVADLQPHLPVEPLVPLETSLALALAPPRIAAWVSGVLGGVGLLLGAVGVYGVTAFAVAQRVREIAIRLALGSTRRAVLALVVRQGMVPPLAGVAAGLLGALAVGRLVSSLLEGVGAADPAAFAGAVAALLVVATVATFLPAWRVVRGRPLARHLSGDRAP